MAGDRGIMMGRDDLHVERIIIRDIHPTGGVIEEAISFLADSFLFAYVVNLCFSLCDQSVKYQRFQIRDMRGMNLFWGNNHNAFVVFCNTYGMVFSAG